MVEKKQLISNRYKTILMFNIILGLIPGIQPRIVRSQGRKSSGQARG
ncbi:hypothetical protein AGR4A_Lc130044 [Agrobacterium tumefaciens str. B6]|uniref:Uncharacterized protein n=1 Tax=Agrobacterium tumefaciens str. B6 TaxID=1183423 RepID=A0A822V753_AGRTU|nr:hypothetical protein AGR4A_Lc130044 [Agrobacterium tumefaciens str. B6]